MRTTEEMTPATLNGSLVADIKAFIEQGKRQAYMSINAAMIETYFYLEFNDLTILHDFVHNCFLGFCLKNRQQGN